MLEWLTESIHAVLSDTNIQRQLVAGFLQRGGLEGWVQVEIANALVRNLPREINLEREVSYARLVDGNANLRADIALAFPNQTRIGVELKVESLFQESSPGGRLNARYIADVEKVSPYAFAPQNTTTVFMVCGVAVTSEANASMQHVVNQLNQMGTLQGRYHAVALLCGRFEDFPIVLYVTTFER
jgi:hypothetical protein